MTSPEPKPDFVARHEELRKEVVLPIDKFNDAANRAVYTVKDNAGNALATTVMLGTLAHGAVGLDSFDANRADQPHADIHHVAEAPKIAGLTSAKFVAPAGESADIIAEQANHVTHVPEAEIKQAVIAKNNLPANGDITPGSVIQVPEVVLPAAPVTSTPAPATPESTSTPEAVKTPTIYQIGDSLSDGVGYVGIVQDYAKNGWAVSKLEATVGDNVGDAIPKLEADSVQVAAATHIVIELGTNNEILGVPHPSADSETEFQGQIQAMITAIKKINPTAEITWVNVHAAGTDVYESINQALQSLQSQLGYNIADWDAFVKANPNIQFDHALGVHPDDYNLMAQFLVNFIGKAPVQEAAPTTTTSLAPITTIPEVAAPTTTTSPPTPAKTTTTPAPKAVKAAPPTTTEAAPTTTTSPPKVESDKPYPNINSDQFVAFLAAELTQESHGHWTDPNNPWMCSGGYQMDPSMWANSFGVQYAYEATPEQQTQIAIQHFASYFNMFEGNWKDMAMGWYAGPGFLADHYDIYARQNGGQFPSLSDYGDSVLNYMQQFQASPSTIPPEIIETAVGLGILPSWYTPPAPPPAPTTTTTLPSHTSRPVPSGKQRS